MLPRTHQTDQRASSAQQADLVAARRLHLHHYLPGRQRFACIGNELRANARVRIDRKSTRLNSSHMSISYAVFCLKKKKTTLAIQRNREDTDLRVLPDLPRTR